MGRKAKGIGHSEKGKERTSLFGYDVVRILRGFFSGKTIVLLPSMAVEAWKSGCEDSIPDFRAAPRTHRGVGKKRRPGYEPEKTESSGGQGVVSEPPGS